MNAVLEPRRAEEEEYPLAPVSVAQLSDAWPACAPWLAKALEHGQGDENLTDILIALARGTYGLWMASDHCTVVQVMKYPRQSVLTILYVGGSLDAIARSFKFAQEYCKANGIEVIRVWGRAGWERVLGLERIGVISQVRVR